MAKTKEEEPSTNYSSRNNSVEKDENDNRTKSHHVVIVGAGMAGLSCARELLEKIQKSRKHDVDGDYDAIKITLLEASDRVGGRIRTDPDFIKDINYHPQQKEEQEVSFSKALDLGAEFIHGKEHILWNWMWDFRELGLLSLPNKDDNVKEDDDWLEEIFILAHADGGPAEEPTGDGMYGMFYVRGELVMYNDPRVNSLRDALELISEKEYDSRASFSDALKSVEGVELDEDAADLCVTGYGNTAGCCDLKQLSISSLQDFETHWEENEIEGDFRLKIGMYSLVEATMKILQQHKNFELVLNCPVEKIRQLGNEGKGVIEIRCTTSHIIHADCAVVTVPPPILPTILNLPLQKERALQHIGFERAIKVICRFSKQLWPPQVQSIISTTDQPIPEIWFRQFSPGCHIAVGFLVSTAADNLVETLRHFPKLSRETEAGQILIRQVSTMFNVPLETFVEAHQDTLMYDWAEHPYIRGGYMYPKVGMTAADRELLAQPMGNDSIFFAGEATNTDACCTVQAAMETGLRAAKEVLTKLTIHPLR